MVCLVITHLSLAALKDQQPHVLLLPRSPHHLQVLPPLLSLSPPPSSTHKSGSITHPGPVNSQCKDRADKLVAEAEAKLRWGPLLIPSSSTSSNPFPSRSMFHKVDQSGALDCYQRATAQYKLAGAWERAGAVYTIMGDMFRKQVLHLSYCIFYLESKAPNKRTLE